MRLEGKDLSDWLKIVVLVATLATGYAYMRFEIGMLATTLSATQKTTERIEHYLSSEDKDYWRKVKQIETDQ